jgi:hypothetical protein
MDLSQIIDRSLVQLLGQSWPIFVFFLAVALLKILLPSRKTGKRRRGSSARSTKAAKVSRTEEERDYDRRLAGVAGELKIRTFVERRYDSSVHDIYLPSRNGVTQIDHVVLIGGAIVVIETKNYGGLIIGDEKGQKWTQVMGKGSARNTFMNPIHQNVGHVSAVRMALGGDQTIPIQNLVVFVGDSTFGRTLPENVIVLSDLASKLGQIAREHPEVGPAKNAWPKLCSHCLAKPRSVLEAEHRETLSRRSGRRQGIAT